MHQQRFNGLTRPDFVALSQLDRGS